jgi:hypothetical protein
MNPTSQASESNPLELEAQAYELEAEASRLRALAKRARIFASASTPTAAEAPRHQTRAEYARRSRVSEATVSRWLAEGMPALPVGSTVRIDVEAADEWRRVRGRRPTKAASKKTTSDDDVDVSGVLGRTGLRVVGRGGR